MSSPLYLFSARNPVSEKRRARFITNVCQEHSGESGVRKSSIINLLAVKQVARTSPDTKHCTLRYEAYDVPINGVQYRIYDTAGADEDPGGFLNAIVNADKLMKELKNKGGVHLLLYCIKAGRIPPTFVTNYRLFY